MFIVDATGRLPIRLFVAQVVTGWQGGFAYDGVAYLVDQGAPAATDVWVLGVRLSSIGCIRVVAPALQANAVDGWPLQADGSVPMYGQGAVVPVATNAFFNGGVAMDAGGVYAIIIP